MRIIAGTKKGRKLQAVPGQSTRPTTDKVKEALFNLLGDAAVDGGYCLDLFAGTGGLGLEALSRGMDKAIFVDQQSRAVSTINENIAAVGFQNECEVYRNDARRAIKALQKRNIKFKLIFLDPPYGKIDLEKLMILIIDNELLDAEGIIVVETGKDTSLPASVLQWQQMKTKVYGDTMIATYHLKEQAMNKDSTS